MDETRHRIYAPMSHPVRWSVIVTAIVAVVIALHLARDALVPVVVAAVLALMLSSVVDMLVWWRMPRWLASAIVVVTMVVMVGSCLNAVWEPARDWLDRAPHMLHTAEQKLRPVARLVAKVESVSDQAARMASPAVPGDSDRPLKVRDDAPGLVNMTLDWTVTLLATVFMTYFLLADGPALLEWLRRRSTGRGRRRPVVVVLAARRILGRYFGALAISSLALGVATTATMFVLDMPSPPLWGTLAFLLNFIPYAGPTVTFSLLVLVALVSFEGIAGAATVGGCFLVLTTLEGQLLQPVLVGRRIRVKPLAVLLALWFGGWLWGFAGVALAAPILAVVKATADAAGWPAPRPQVGADTAGGVRFPRRWRLHRIRPA
jgi:predicted PurR-regulated permease PerM